MADPIRPVGMSNRDFENGSGADHSGALVTVWGVVTEENAASEYFVVSDGSTPNGVKVSYSELVSGNVITPPSVDAQVSVSGISSVESSGAKLLKVRSQGDIREME